MATRRRFRIPLAALLALALAAGCATTGLTPEAPSQPVARAALRPEYRVFYDTLKDYGDWVSIEPFGFVFRPDVSWNLWQPYRDGFWAATDAYGWVWISAEPFGWATDHYGEWLYDRFQGWVWLPGLDWAPAWVSWQIAGDYAGWAPLSGRSDLARSSGSTVTAPPTSTLLYAPLAQLGAADLQTRLVTREQVGDAAATPEPVRNLERVQGVTFNRGPSFERVEAVGGPLPRARIEDLVPSAPGPRAEGRVPPDGAPAREGNEDLAAQTRRAAERAAADAKRFAGAPGSRPISVPLVRPRLGAEPDSAGAPARPDRRAPARGRSVAPPDTSR